MTDVAERIGARLLDSPLATTASLHRQADGSRNEYGEFVPGAVTAIDINVVTVPISGEERESLPEGLRERDVRKFWLSGPVEAIVAGEQEGDIVRYKSTDFRVMQADDWDGFYEVLAVHPEAVPA